VRAAIQDYRRLITGRQITLPIVVLDANGVDRLDLTGHTVDALVKMPSGTLISRGATNRVQTGDDVGISDLVLASGENSTAGDLQLQVFVDTEALESFRLEVEAALT